MQSYNILYTLTVIAFLCSVSALKVRDGQDNAALKLFGGRSSAQRNVHENEERSTMLREIANSFKTLGDRSLKGRGLPENNAFKFFGGRSLMKRFTDTEKCDKLEEALEDIIEAVNSEVSAEQGEAFRQAFLDNTDIDINDKEAVRTQLCLITSVDSLEDVVLQSGWSPDEAESKYQVFVDSINQVRTSLRDLAGNSYLTEGMREVVNAAIRFYDVYEEIGMLSLS